MNVSIFHLYQFLAIYMPGAALIPATVVTSFYSATYAAITASVLLLIVAAAILYRPRLAERLDLDRDHE